MDLVKHARLRPLTAGEFDRFAFKVRQGITLDCRTEEMVIRLVKTIEAIRNSGQEIPRRRPARTKPATHRPIPVPAGVLPIDGPADKLYVIRILEHCRGLLDHDGSAETRVKTHLVAMAINNLRRLIKNPQAAPKISRTHNTGPIRDGLRGKGFDVDTILRWLYPQKPAWADGPIDEIHRGAVADFHRFKTELGMRSDIAKMAVATQAYGAFYAISRFHRFDTRDIRISPEAIDALITAVYGKQRPEWGSRMNLGRARQMDHEHKRLLYSFGLTRRTALMVLARLTGLTKATAAQEMQQARYIGDILELSNEETGRLLAELYPKGLPEWASLEKTRRSSAMLEEYKRLIDDCGLMKGTAYGVIARIAGVGINTVYARMSKCRCLQREAESRMRGVKDAGPNSRAAGAEGSIGAFRPAISAEQRRRMLLLEKLPEPTAAESEAGVGLFVPTRVLKAVHARAVAFGLSHEEAEPSMLSIRQAVALSGCSRTAIVRNLKIYRSRLGLPIPGSRNNQHRGAKERE